MEELIDLEQQAEFFVVLGQDEAAIDLLMSHLRGTGGSSPLPYLKLLEIYRRRGDRDAYERIRERFNRALQRLRARVGRRPAARPRARGLSADGGAAAGALVDAAVGDAELDALLFRREEADETFDLPAYRELLFLYSMARELAENVETDFGSIDLLLPLDDAPVEAARSQHGELAVTRRSAARSRSTSTSRSGRKTRR